MYNTKQKIKDGLDAIDRKFDDRSDGLLFRVSKKFVEPKKMSGTTAQRLAYAGAGAIFATAAGHAANKLIHRIMHRPSAFPKSRLVSAAILGSALGYMTPSIHNTLFDSNHEDLSSNKAEKEYRQIMNFPVKRLKKIEEKFHELESMPQMLKTSSIVGMATKGLIRQVRGFGTAAGRSLLPHGWSSYYAAKGLKVPFGVNVFKWGTRAAAGYGAYRGGRALYTKHVRRPAEKNYTTFLRNNILSGHIEPSQLGERDRFAVQKAGM